MGGDFSRTVFDEE
jgi:hypothetical protein